MEPEDAVTQEIPEPLQKRSWWVLNVRDTVHEAIRNVEGAAKFASNGCSGYIDQCNDALFLLNRLLSDLNKELGHEKQDKRTGVYSRVLRAVCQEQCDYIETFQEGEFDDFRCEGSF